MRGMCLHRFFALGLITAAAALMAGPAAHAGGAPPFSRGATPVAAQVHVHRLLDRAVRPAAGRVRARGAPCAGRDPVPTDSQQRTTAAQSRPVPDVFERAVLRAQATKSSTGRLPSWVLGAGIPSQGVTQTESLPSWVLGAAIPSQGVTQTDSYTPAAVRAMGQRWEAYAAAQGANGTGSQLSDSRRSDLPAASPASTTSVDDTGIAWLDVVYGVLLGFGLVVLGGLGAMAVRTHGRVAQP